MRLRLGLSFVAVVLVTLGSMIYFARSATQQAVGEYMIRGGMVSTEELLGTLGTYYEENGTWDGVQRVIRNAGGMGQMMGWGAGNGQRFAMMSQRIRVADADGLYVYDSQSESVGTEMTSAERNTSQTISSKSGTVVGYLVAEGGIGNEGTLLQYINSAALRSGLISGGIALVFALLLAYTLVKPIQQLSQAAQLLAQGDLSQRVKVQGKDELSNLGRTFNQMAVNLQQSEQTRRAMTADIAHELRTPLAIQRAQLEALQDNIYPLTLENLKPIVDQNVALDHLVDDLRTLALSEAGELRLAKKWVQISDCVSRALERFQPQVVGRQIELQYDSSQAENCPDVYLDPNRVDQILGNLLSNAIRYTPDEGRVYLTLTCSASAVALSVRDSGPGIPSEALPFIFQRFYRADRSRSRSDGGTGLGLAIARNLAEAMGGTLIASNSKEGGAEFLLSFPTEKH